jgi:hypothetical protein
MLADFLSANQIKQSSLVDEINKRRPNPVDKSQVNRWARDPDPNPTRETIDSILVALTSLLGRQVSYEEVFGQELSPAANE